MPKTKKVSAGYYRKEIITTYDGVEVVGLAEIIKREDGLWYFRIELNDGSVLTEGEDLYFSKKFALDALLDCCESGFKHYPGLGICSIP